MLRHVRFSFLHAQEGLSRNDFRRFMECSNIPLYATDVLFMHVFTNYAETVECDILSMCVFTNYAETGM